MNKWYKEAENLLKKRKKKSLFCLKSQKNLQISVSVCATDTNDNFSQGP